MTTTEHLLFLALMIPTFVLLVLAAISLADPAPQAANARPPQTAQVAVTPRQRFAEEARDDEAH